MKKVSGPMIQISMLTKFVFSAADNNYKRFLNFLSILFVFYYTTQVMKQEENQIRCVDENSKKKQLYFDESIFRASLNRLDHFLVSTTQIQIDSLENILSEYAGKPIKIQMNPTKAVEIMNLRIVKMQKSKNMRKYWPHDEEEVLNWLVCKYCELRQIDMIEKLENQDWQFISSLIPAAQSSNCMLKVLKLKDIKLTENIWTDDQSELLQQIVKEQLGNVKYISQVQLKFWSSIAEELYKRNKSIEKVYRKPQHCRRRWLSFLSPDIVKGKWSEEQDYVLVDQMVKRRGSMKWLQMTKYFHGRTQNAIKNRFHSIIDKIYRKYPRLNKIQQMEKYLQIHQRPKNLDSIYEQIMNKKKEIEANLHHSENLVDEKAPKAQDSHEKLTFKLPEKTEKLQILNFQVEKGEKDEIQNLHQGPITHLMLEKPMDFSYFHHFNRQIYEKELMKRQITASGIKNSNQKYFWNFNPLYGYFPQIRSVKQQNFEQDQAK